MADVISTVEEACVIWHADGMDDHILIRAAPISFWLKVLSKVSKSGDRCSAEASRTIAAVCKHHEQELDADIFNEMTQGLSCVSPHAASALLVISLSFDTMAAVTSFQEKCLSSMAKNLVGGADLQLPEGCSLPVTHFNRLMVQVRECIKERYE